MAVILLMGAVAGLLAVACGGDEALKSGTYRNTEYGFSFSYPDGFAQVQPKQSAATAGLDFVVQFADLEGRVDSVGADGEYMRSLMVGIARLQGEPTLRQRKDALRESRRALLVMPRDIPSVGYWDMEVEHAELVTFLGQPALRSVLTYTNEHGGRQHNECYMFFQGVYYFAVQVEAPDDAWGASATDFRRVLDSFIVL